MNVDTLQFLRKRSALPLQLAGVKRASGEGSQSRYSAALRSPAGGP